jgi:hypothetical protein
VTVEGIEKDYRAQIVNNGKGEYSVSYVPGEEGQFTVRLQLT